MEQQLLDVVIVGGSFAGLSAALSLGRSSRRVLVIDNGNPCNRNTPNAHNFLTNDGSRPCDITERAKAQLLQYPTVTFLEGTVTDVSPVGKRFEIITENNKKFTSRKVLFATGVTDTLPHIDGFAECWGISILHCPYCHGYEVKNKKLGVLGNGDMGYELAKVISHWTDSLTLYTNGTSTLSPEEVQRLNKHNIIVVENEIEAVIRENGQIKQLQFKDTEPDAVDAVFTQLPFMQQCPLPEALGCELTEKGFIQVDKCLETTVPGVYAAGDCLTLFRSIANAVAAGNKVGGTINKQLIEEDF